MKSISILIISSLFILSCKEKKPDNNYLFTATDAVIAISQVHNYCQAKETFTLDKDQLLAISSTGEIQVGQKNGHRDVLELYLDMNNEKGITFSSKKHKFLYFSEIEGSSTEVKSAFFNSDAHTYHVEICVPFSIFNKPLVAGRTIGFDFCLNDNDNGFDQEKKIAWHADDSDIWLNPQLWGTLLLSKSREQQDTGIVSTYTTTRPVIDGKEDPCWANATSVTTTHVLYGNVKNTPDHTDISGTLKSIWQEDAVYFFVTVSDDNIVRESYNGRVFDHGWIEDESGKVVWQLDREHAKHAGGAGKNVVADTIMQLSKGKYYLCYQSDESHAYKQWDNIPPSNDFYGISIRKIAK